MRLRIRVGTKYLTFYFCVFFFFCFCLGLVFEERGAMGNSCERFEIGRAHV